MVCIKPESWIDLLERGGLESATAPESSHLQTCFDCRETWASLAGADRLLTGSTRRADRWAGHAARIAAAVILSATLVVLFWNPLRPATLPAVGKRQEDPFDRMIDALKKAPQDPPTVYEPQPEASSTCTPAPAEDQAPTLIVKKPAPRFMVAVSARFFESPGEERTPSRWRVTADPGELQRFVRAVQAPRITAYDGQLSHILSADQTACIRGYEVTFAKDGTGSAPSPVIDFALTGTGIEVRPVVVDEAGGAVKLSLKVVVWERQENIREIQTPHGMVQDPGAQSVTYDLDPTLSKGETLVVGPMTGALGRKQPFYALFTCDVLPFEAEEGAVIKDFPLDRR